jgi:hypothetical protein
MQTNLEDIKLQTNLSNIQELKSKSQNPSLFQLSNGPINFMVTIDTCVINRCMLQFMVKEGKGWDYSRQSDNVLQNTDIYGWECSVWEE